jgi:threonine/homoserine/homoserine lactone efflux protein
MGTFIATALVLIMIPGPDQALITRNALAGGRLAGLLTMIGGALGLTVHAGTATLGISALLVASATAFTVLKVVGTGYLVWMGIQTLRAARRAARSGEPVPERPVRAAASAWRSLRQGFLSNSLNPKVALFFVTFLPQFLTPGGNTAGQAMLLSVVFAGLYLVWFGVYVLGVDLLGTALRKPRVKAAIERVTGALLIGFGGMLATASA